MPPNPKNVEDTVTISDDYADEPATIDFYTNNAIAIGRDRDDPKEGVWLDNLEKRELLRVLQDNLGHE